MSGDGHKTGGTSPDFATVLTTEGPLLTKRILRGADGKLAIRDYDDARHFGFSVRELDNIDELANLLDTLSRNVSYLAR